MLQSLVTVCSLAVSLIAIALSGYFWLKTKQQNKEITRNIRDNHNLISSTTDLLTVSERIGIKAAYENRQMALQSFKKIFKQEDKLIVIGSSLKGLRMYVPEFDKILKARTSRGLENRFLLTHPCYSTFREEKEFREPGDIKKEVEGTLSFLTDHGVKDQDIRLYLGTPTSFTVITRSSMLINPYPYQIESFRCFCLEVERKPIADVSDQIGDAMFLNKDGFPGKKPPRTRPSEEKDVQYLKLIDEARIREFIQELKDNTDHNYTYDIAPDIYGQFYWYHYLLPWYSKFSIGLTQYRKHCQCEIERCIEKRMRLACPLTKVAWVIEQPTPIQPTAQVTSTRLNKKVPAPATALPTDTGATTSV